MAISKNREYRNIGQFKISDNCLVVGYAATFDRYEMMEIDGKKYYEQISRDAFNGADLSDVVFLRDHKGAVLARTKNKTVELWIDNHGLAARTNLGLTAASREMYEDIKVGNYQQMSFSFTVAQDHFDEKTSTRVIDKIKKVFDISAVAFPANPYTSIGLDARDYFDRVREKEALKLKLKLAQNRGR